MPHNCIYNYTVTKKTCLLYLFRASSLMSDGCHVTKGISWAKCTTCCPVPDPNSRPSSSWWDWSSSSSHSTDSKPSWLRSAAGESSMICHKKGTFSGLLLNVWTCLCLYAMFMILALCYCSVKTDGSGDYLDKRLLSAPPLQVLHKQRTLCNVIKEPKRSMQLSLSWEFCEVGWYLIYTALWTFLIQIKRERLAAAQKIQGAWLISIKLLHPA